MKMGWVEKQILVIAILGVLGLGLLNVVHYVDRHSQQSEAQADTGNQPNSKVED